MVVGGGRGKATLYLCSRYLGVSSRSVLRDFPSRDLSSIRANFLSRKAGEEHGMGDWEVLPEGMGHPVDEVWVRKKRSEGSEDKN